MAKKRRLGLSSSSKMKYDSRGDDVMVARDRLKGALEELLQSDDESSSSQEETPVTPIKPTPIKKEPKPPPIRRRKRKSTLDVELAFHHTFVMKLYDRSVDLAQFQENTPLYPICRAWIANQPRLPSPYPAQETTEIKNEDEGMFELDPDVVKDVYKLPPPSCPPFGSRIPPVRAPQLQGINLDYNSAESLPTAEDLLKDHLTKWKKTRQKWIQAAELNDSRFQNSVKILANMIKKSQSPFM